MTLSGPNDCRGSTKLIVSKIAITLASYEARILPTYLDSVVSKNIKIKIKMTHLHSPVQKHMSANIHLEFRI